jgi:hypothetical protein
MRYERDGPLLRVVGGHRGYIAGPRDIGVTARLRAAGFVPGETNTVMIGLTAELPTDPALPRGVVLRWVTADADMRRIATMLSAV